METGVTPPPPFPGSRLPPRVVDGRGGVGRFPDGRAVPPPFPGGVTPPPPFPFRSRPWQGVPVGRGLPLASAERSGLRGWIVLLVGLIVAVGGMVPVGLHFRGRQVEEQAGTQVTALVAAAGKYLEAGRLDEAARAADEALRWRPGDSGAQAVSVRVEEARALRAARLLEEAGAAMAAAGETARVDIGAALALYQRLAGGAAYPEGIRAEASAQAERLRGKPCVLRLPGDWPADAVLTVDGVPREAEGGLVSGLPVGTVRIGFSRPGHRPPPGIELALVGTDPAEVPAVAWELLGGRVKLASDPSGAAVWREGKDTGKTTPCVFEDVDVGRVSYLLKHAGRADTVVEGEVATGAELELRAALPWLPVLPEAGTTAGERREFNLTEKLRVPFRWCPPGSFQMGGPGADERPLRRVSLSKGFWIMETEMTQAQWEAVSGSMAAVVFAGASNERVRPAIGPDRPMVRLSWEAICGDHGRKGGLLGRIHGYLQKAASSWVVDLPTEAQWEYACRAGTTGALASGAPLAPGTMDRLAVHAGNSRGSASVVGRREANPWGLHDMHGNVHEWCRDWYQDSYQDLGNEDPVGPRLAWKRVVRGGSFASAARLCTSHARASAYESAGSALIGFRLVLYAP